MLLTDQVNSVLLANSFNLPIFQQLWLLDNGIVKKEEFEAGNFFFTPVAASVPTPAFNLLIVPERAQTTIVNNIENSQEIFERVTGGIVSKLPHTPFTAIGLNFNYRINPNSKENFLKKCQQIFIGQENPLCDEFDAEDCRFGTYMSKDVFDARLRLDIKPIRQEDSDQILVSCNLHADENQPDKIMNLLSNWTKIYEYTTLLATKLDKKLEEA